MLFTPDICYICGEKLNDIINKDHVPPKLFYPPQLRKTKAYNQLDKIQVHQGCNTAYREDEEYFVHTFAPFLNTTRTGKLLRQHIATTFQKGRNVNLGQMISNEFAFTYGSLQLPSGKMINHFNINRISRVLDKISRGLHYIDNKSFLKHDLTYHVLAIKQFSDVQPQLFNYFDKSKNIGKYPDIMDYSNIKIDNNCLVWLFIFWDYVI